MDLDRCTYVCTRRTWRTTCLISCKQASGTYSARIERTTDREHASTMTAPSLLKRVRQWRRSGDLRKQNHLRTFFHGIFLRNAAPLIEHSSMESLYRNVKYMLSVHILLHCYTNHRGQMEKEDTAPAYNEIGAGSFVPTLIPSFPM